MIEIVNTFINNFLKKNERLKNMDYDTFNKIWPYFRKIDKIIDELWIPKKNTNIKNLILKSKEELEELKDILSANSINIDKSIYEDLLAVLPWIQEYGNGKENLFEIKNRINQDRKVNRKKIINSLDQIEFNKHFRNEWKKMKKDLENNLRERIR